MALLRWGENLLPVIDAVGDLVLCGYVPLREKLILSLRKNTFSLEEHIHLFLPALPSFPGPRAQVNWRLVWKFCSCHLALRRGCAAHCGTGLPDAKFFFPVSLIMTAMDILGIIAENLSPQIPMLCGYYPTWEKLFFRKLKMSFSF